MGFVWAIGCHSHCGACRQLVLYCHMMGPIKNRVGMRKIPGDQSLPFQPVIVARPKGGNYEKIPFVVSLAEIESSLNLHRLFLKSRAGPDP